MKNKKKIIISIIVLIFVIGLIRGDFVIETNFNSNKYENKVEISKEDLEEYINKDPDYVEYFDNVDDAFSKSRLTDYKGVKNILKTFEIGNNIVLFTMGDGEESNEEFSRYRLKVKKSGEQKEYSQPLEGISTDYANIKSSSNEIVKKWKAMKKQDCGGILEYRINLILLIQLIL